MCCLLERLFSRKISKISYYERWSESTYIVTKELLGINQSINGSNMKGPTSFSVGI